MKRFMIRLLAILAATSAMLFVSQPQNAFAQASGVGVDGDTSVLWTGTDSSIVMWRLDPTLGVIVANQTYGPYAGWTPIATTTDVANYTHVLWRYTDGTAAVWALDANLNYVGSVFFGPYFAWTPQTLSADPTTAGTRLVWKRTTGAISIFALTSNGTLAYEGVYGPYPGYEPGASSASTRTLHAGPSKLSKSSRVDGKRHDRAALDMQTRHASKDQLLK